MCPLVMDLISLFDFLSRGGKAYLHLNSCEGQSMGSLIISGPIKEKLPSATTRKATAMRAGTPQLETSSCSPLN